MTEKCSASASVPLYSWTQEERVEDDLRSKSTPISELAHTVLFQEQRIRFPLHTAAANVLRGIPLSEFRKEVSENALARLYGLSFVHPECVDLLLSYAINLPVILETKDRLALHRILRGHLELLQNPRELRRHLWILLD